MGLKNLLADTNYTAAFDNRFKNAIVIGKVSKIECSDKGANVRVMLNDKVDLNKQPLITKPIPVWQASAGVQMQGSGAGASNGSGHQKKSFAMPRIGQNVVLVKLPNATGDYLLLGTFYTKNDPPPVTDPRVDYCEWENGHTEKFDSNDNADVFLTQDFKAGWKGTYKKDVSLKTTDSAKFNIEADGDVLVKSANGNVTVESPTGTVTISQDTIELQGNSAINITAPEIKLTGHVTIIGDMIETGHHVDSKGPHASSMQERDELLARVNALEERVKRLEAVILKTI